jgi:hypothetical protein
MESVVRGRLDVTKRLHTDESGQFELELHGDQTAFLDVEMEANKRLKFARVELNPQSIATAAEIWKIRPLLCSLSGTLKFPTGVPVPERCLVWYRTVSLRPAKTSMEREAQFMADDATYVEAKNGVFAIFGLVAGKTYELYLDQEQKKTLSVESGSRVQFDGTPIRDHTIVLRPTAPRRVSIQFNSEDGKPITQAVVRILGSSESVTTDARGRAVVQCSDVDDFIVAAKGYCHYRAPVVETAPGVVEVTLTRAYDVPFEVIDLDGSPAANVRVTVAQFAQQFGRELSGISDKDGRLVISGLAMGPIQISAGGSATSIRYLEETSVLPGKAVTIQLQPTHQVKLSVAVPASVVPELDGILITQAKTMLIALRAPIGGPAHEMALPTGEYDVYGVSSHDMDHLYLERLRSRRCPPVKSRKWCLFVFSTRDIRRHANLTPFEPGRSPRTARVAITKSARSVHTAMNRVAVVRDMLFLAAILRRHHEVYQNWIHNGHCSPVRVLLRRLQPDPLFGCQAQAAECGGYDRRGAEEQR